MLYFIIMKPFYIFKFKIWELDHILGGFLFKKCSIADTRVNQSNCFKKTSSKRVSKIQSKI